MSYLDRLEQQLVEAAARAEAPRRRRLARPLRLAPAAAVLALALLALALPLAIVLSGGGDQAPGAAALDGRYTSPFTESPAVAPGRGFRPGSRLRIAGGRFALETDTYGLLGSVEVGDRTARFQSPGGYARLPNLTTGGQPLPDPGSQCQILPGEYRWRIDGDRLTFRVVDDRCAARVRQLTARPWAPVR